MAATTLQTRIMHRRHTSINVNGTHYDIDGNGCVSVSDPAHIKRLLALGDEWSTDVRTGLRSNISRLPKPGASLRSATDFVELIASDKDVAAQITKLRSFYSVQSLARRLGFKFDENEYNDATALHTARANADAAREAAAAQVVKQAKHEKAPKAEKVEKASSKGSKGKTRGGPAAEVAEVELGADGLPVVLPEEETGEWPDPDNTMEPRYLRRMASAYKVAYDPDMPTDVLIERIQAKMYEDDAT